MSSTRISQCFKVLKIEDVKNYFDSFNPLLDKHVDLIKYPKGGDIYYFYTEDQRKKGTFFNSIIQLFCQNFFLETLKKSLAELVFKQVPEFAKTFCD